MMQRRSKDRDWGSCVDPHPDHPASQPSTTMKNALRVMGQKSMLCMFHTFLQEIREYLLQSLYQSFLYINACLFYMYSALRNRCRNVHLKVFVVILWFLQLGGWRLIYKDCESVPQITCRTCNSFGHYSWYGIFWNLDLKKFVTAIHSNRFRFQWLGVAFQHPCSCLGLIGAFDIFAGSHRNRHQHRVLGDCVWSEWSRSRPRSMEPCVNQIPQKNEQWQRSTIEKICNCEVSVTLILEAKGLNEGLEAEKSRNRWVWFWFFG